MSQQHSDIAEERKTEKKIEEGFNTHKPVGKY